MSFGFRGAVLLSMALILIGCQREEIRVYRVPHEAPPSLAAVSGAESPDSGIHWTLPSGWKQLPAQMPRLALFDAGGAEISITQFPGDAGGVFANVNRWRGQLGLPSLQEGQADGVRPLQGGGVAIRYLKLENPALDKAMMVGFFAAHGATYFVKLTGTLAQVRGLDASFVSFLRGITVDETH